MFGHLTPPEDVADKEIITRCIGELKYTVDDIGERVRLLEHHPYAGSPTDPDPPDVPTASSFERLQQDVKNLDEVVDRRDTRVYETEENIGILKAEVEELQGLMEKGNIVTDDELREILPGLATKSDLEELRLLTKSDLEELRLLTKSDLEELRLLTKSDIEELRLSTRSDIEELRLSTRSDIEKLRDELRQEFRLSLSIEAAKSHNHRTSRFFDIVQPVPVTLNQDGAIQVSQLSTSLRQVKHYWNLHNPGQALELVRLLNFYLPITDWPFKPSNESDEFDRMDVDLLGPLLPTVPASWEEAVRISPRRSVYLLFGALGLRYEHFADQNAKMKALSVQRREGTKVKADAAHQQPSAVRVKKPRNPSSGSTTDPFTT